MRLENLIRAVINALTPTRGSSSTAARPARHPAARPSSPSSARPSPRERPTPGQPGGSSSGATAAVVISEYDVARYGAPRLAYAPDRDGDADPGEIVWGWVPYEEDASQGKDRPLLVIGSGGGQLVGVQLTSKDHTRDAGREAARGRVWFDIGSGDWDSQGRDSEVRLDRLLLVPPAGVRREGAILDRARFDQVVAALRDAHAW